jgi:hypothetical protein
MLVLVLLLAFIVLLLGILVAGLLRSHADIVKALHDLGAGVGDPAANGSAGHEHRQSDTGGADSVRVPLTIGPSLPAERDSTSAPTLSGVTPYGDALAIAVSGSDTLTLIAFLSSGCSTCANFWNALRNPDELGLPEGVRCVVVTKGPEMEISSEVRAKADPRLRVIMSTEAWSDYEVPGSPFFALVDGRTGRRIGEGVAQRFSQVTELVRRAHADVRPFGLSSHGRAMAEGLDGPARESANDQELLAAGIHPGHQSLYPSTLADIFPPDSTVRIEPRPSGGAAKAW